MVVFGASGDLAHRKIIPSLYALFRKGFLPEDFFMLGAARTEYAGDEFRDLVSKSLRDAFPDDSAEALDGFVRLCYYVSGDYDNPEFHRSIADLLADLSCIHRSQGNLLFYLSVPPSLYEPIVAQLAETGMTLEADGVEGWRRVVFEKPFGHDLESSRKLDADLHRHLNERQIYRIDHYLGKETVQNMFMFRFANTIFEPIWNRRYVDHVQITVAESVGVEHRAGYYDQTGLLRDMFQNHMLQLLTLVAMEPPTAFEADPVRNEKVKLLQAVRPLTAAGLSEAAIRGQYGPGTIGDGAVCGYRAEEGVPEGSRTETYAALRLMIDNWRWQGVPFYLRSGKRMARRVSEVAVTFKRIPYSVFQPLAAEQIEPNVLVLNVQPEEGIGLSIQAKRPGTRLSICTLEMDFRYREVFGEEPPEAYQRLLLDCMLGDQTLFARHDNIAVSWELLRPLLDAWASAPEDSAEFPLHSYPAGSWGAEAADRLMERDGRAWRRP
jgi:glucose-6-phosphate 1-dehydrogenase